MRDLVAAVIALVAVVGCGNDGAVVQPQELRLYVDQAQDVAPSVCAVPHWQGDTLYCDIVLDEFTGQIRALGTEHEFAGLVWIDFIPPAWSATWEGYGMGILRGGLLRIGGFDSPGDGVLVDGSPLLLGTFVFVNAPGPDWIENTQNFDDIGAVPAGCRWAGESTGVRE